ncbi:MAG TPA: hypothetical protein VLJ59_08535 [Mycobacteriales bacterium]|nr:hypothetical protein [Mycobacteriales bacterium]
MIILQSCAHERGHLDESRLYGHRYATEVSRRIFCEHCRAARLADVTAAADEVGVAATDQDLHDTAQALELRDVLDELDAVLRNLAAHLIGVADRHPAEAGTVAARLAELLRHAERIGQVRVRVVAVRLSGMHPTQAAEDFAGRLGLAGSGTDGPFGPDLVAEFVSALATVAATLSRVAGEARSVRLASRATAGCEQVVTLARLAVGQLSPAFAGGNMPWRCVPDVSHYTLAAAEITREVVAGLARRGRLAVVPPDEVTGPQWEIERLAAPARRVVAAAEQWLGDTSGALRCA